MTRAISRFLRRQDGAVTVNCVVLAAAIGGKVTAISSHPGQALSWGA